MSLMIGDHSVVSIHYKLSDNDGNVIDTSEGVEPSLICMEWEILFQA